MQRSAEVIPRKKRWQGKMHCVSTRILGEKRRPSGGTCNQASPRDPFMQVTRLNIPYPWIREIDYSCWRQLYIPQGCSPPQLPIHRLHAEADKQDLHRIKAAQSVKAFWRTSSLHIPSKCALIFNCYQCFKQKQQQMFSYLAELFFERAWCIGGTAWFLFWSRWKNWWHFQPAEVHAGQELPVHRRCFCIFWWHASVNYRKHHSVLENLKVSKHRLIQDNCNCHVLHMAKFSCRLQRYNVEGLFIKSLQWVFLIS